MRIAVAGGTGVAGQHVVAALEADGHEAVVLTRSAGVDLMSGVGLADVLRGTDAVVDVTSKLTTRASVSRDFFGTVTRNLLDAEHEAGVPHHVALSIVGAASVDAGYFAGKRTQEKPVLTASGAGWTLLRATQFHEFAPQTANRVRLGPISVIPLMATQPVAAAEVGAALAKLATGKPQGVVPDLGGPRVENLASMVRRYLAATGSHRSVLEVPLPGAWGRSLRDGSVLPKPGAQLGIQTYEDWLAKL